MLWGRLSPWKWVPGISTGVKAAGAYGWRLTTLVVPNVKKIRGLNLPGTSWATSACCGVTFTFTFLMRNNPEERSSHLFRGGSLQPYIWWVWLMCNCRAMRTGLRSLPAALVTLQPDILTGWWNTMNTGFRVSGDTSPLRW